MSHPAGLSQKISLLFPAVICGIAHESVNDSIGTHRDACQYARRRAITQRHLVSFVAPIFATIH